LRGSSMERLAGPWLESLGSERNEEALDGGGDVELRPLHAVAAARSGPRLGVRAQLREELGERASRSLVVLSRELAEPDERADERRPRLLSAAELEEAPLGLGAL